MPLYVLGLMGVTRRMSRFDDQSLQIWFIIAAIGAVFVAIGIGSMLMQFLVSFLRRDQNRDLTGDPWNGRTLEWSTSSPPPDYNFAFTPRVYDTDTYADMKALGYKRPREGFVDIHMPANTGAGFIIAFLSFVFGFALVWQIWWLAVVGLLATVVAVIVHTFNYKRDFYIPAADVIRTENARSLLLDSHA
jgi:cytochrome o ubiquinol oxidase subunit 1